MKRGGINNMSNLQLITTENFGGIPCDFYRNMNNDILLTREQIGSALEYTNPRTAIKISTANTKTDQMNYQSELNQVGIKTSPPQKAKNRKGFITLNEGLWKYADGRDNLQLTSSWIGVGM